MNDKVKIQIEGREESIILGNLKITGSLLVTDNGDHFILPGDGSPKLIKIKREKFNEDILSVDDGADPHDFSFAGVYIEHPKMEIKDLTMVKDGKNYSLNELFEIFNKNHKQI